MIVVERLRKTFGTHDALNGLSFTIQPGMVTGLLGRNGAGKSTCLRILSGILRQTSGMVSVAGFDNIDQPSSMRASLGYLSESAPLYPELRVVEYLGFRAQLKGLARHTRAARIAAVLNLVNAGQLGHVRCGQLSRGYQKRVSLADAILADPPVLLLDEPTAGLDPTQSSETRELIAEFSKTRTVIVSSHILSEVESLCGRALLLDQGKLLAEGSIEGLLAQGQATELSATVRGNKTRLVEVLPLLSRQVSWRELSPELFLLEATVQDPEQLDAFAEELSQKLVQSELHLREIKRKTRHLEEVFASLTVGASRS